MSAGKLLVQYPRSDVQALEIKGGMVPEAHFVLRDGTNHILECGRVYVGQLRKVKELLAL
jgi:hypothetical protein